MSRKPKVLPQKQPGKLPRPATAKTWTWRLIAMTGAPLVFLGVLEAALSLSGFGYPTGFLLPRSEHGRDLLIQNNQFGRRFFGARMSRLPSPIAIARHKAPGSIRIFVFGESAAFGDPQPAFGLPRMLEAMLELRHPDAKFEVVNAAMTAINSHAVLDIALDCAHADGDVWVVYMGNNEVVGPFGAGTVFGSQSLPLPILRASLALKATHIGQLLDALRQKLQPTMTEKREWGGMEMFLDHKVAADDPRMPRVYQNLEGNLADIIHAGRACGAGIVVSTLAVNLRDAAPFASLHRPGLSSAQTAEWERLYKEGIKVQAGGNPSRGATQFQAAAHIDNSYADLRFRLGQCALALGDTTTARTEFVAARNLDALRFRCDSHLNQIIRDLATKAGGPDVLLADAEQAVAAASPDGLSGADLFYEHVHLTFAGNYFLAKTIGEKVETLLAPKLTASLRPWPQMADCAARLAWTGRAQQMALSEMLGRLTDPPFTSQLNHAQQQERLLGLARKLAPADSPGSLREARAACETALASWPDDAVLNQQLAELKQAQADYSGAAAAATRSLDVLPSNQQCWIQLGLALAKQQKFEDAAAAFQRGIDLDQQDVWGRQDLALCLQKLKQPELAISQFKHALELKPQFGLAWLGLGQLYEQMGRKQEAADCFQRAIAYRIHRWQELATLARFCVSRRWFEAASTNFTDAVALNPSDANLRLEAGQSLAELGRSAEAARCFEEASRISPDLGQAHFLYGLELGRMAKPAEAEPEFRQAVRLMPDVVEARLNLAISLFQQNKLQKALQEFEQVLKRSPTNTLALKYVQSIQSDARRSD